MTMTPTLQSELFFATEVMANLRYELGHAQRLLASAQANTFDAVVARLREAGATSISIRSVDHGRLPEWSIEVKGEAGEYGTPWTYGERSNDVVGMLDYIADDLEGRA
jgi:hypothetical protein